MKKFLVRFIAVLLAFQGIVAAQLFTLNVAQASGAPEVAINEVMWMGSTQSTDDQWIELHNTTATPIDVSGWTLSNTSLPAIPASSEIPAGGYFLIANSIASNSVLDIEADWVTASISLLNTCSQIDLVKPDLTVVDSMGCNGASYFYPAASSTKHALERVIGSTDGTLSTSWYERTEGSVNLDLGVTDLATPMFINDVSAPNGGTVGEGVAGGEVDWVNSTSSLPVFWSGFVDNESGISPTVLIGIGTSIGSDDVVAFTEASAAGQTTLNSLSLAENTQYYTSVKAINGVGLIGNAVSSDGFMVNTTAPVSPTNIMAEDVIPDNGGSIEVSWDPSVSNDEITYQLNYREVGEPIWTPMIVGTNLSQIVSGLENAPTVYEFMVRSIDFSNQLSAESNIVTESARDNEGPIVNDSKIVVSQNTPGSVDTVSGVVGSVNEDSTVYILDSNMNPLGSVSSNGDGSFAAISIGDNTNSLVYVQAVDSSGNPSLKVSQANDIVGPSAPTMEKIVAECQSESCRVVINWQDNGPDTDNFQLNYLLDGVTHQTFAINGEALVMDLPTGKEAEFRVIAIDQYGNQSDDSNQLSLQLTAGVRTVVTADGTSQKTSTEAMSSSREILVSGVKDQPLSSLIPKASAADSDNDDSNGSNGTNGDNDAVQEARDQDWTRIVIVVLLLLAIAGGFYSLSRSFKDAPTVIPASTTAATKTKKKPTTSRKGKATKSARKRRK